MTDINDALREFEATEANLSRLERLWEEIVEIIPEGVAFMGPDTDYDNKCRTFRLILAEMPKLYGFEIGNFLLGLNEIGQMRLDAMEVGEPELHVHTESAIFHQGEVLSEYRFHYNKARKELIRNASLELVEEIDSQLHALKEVLNMKSPNKVISNSKWDSFKVNINQLETLFGSSLQRPDRWGHLLRHIRFGEMHDLRDILGHDWPAIKISLEKVLYEKDDPIPIKCKDLSEIVNAKPTGKVVTELNWSKLNDKGFERLIYNLISYASGYENPEWLTHTNAPDGGRDLSVTRIMNDPLSGVERKRVIIQCRHWLSKSIGVKDIAETREQMRLWEPPRVDILIVVTSGRFTKDAVSLIEKHNQSNEALHIEMWPESHLERLLSNRPQFIADFGLRK